MTRHVTRTSNRVQDCLGVLLAIVTLGMALVPICAAGERAAPSAGSFVSGDKVSGSGGAWVTTPLVDCGNLTRFDAKYYPATQKVYILGGRYGSETHGTIYAFDPVAQTCSDTGAVMPTPVSNYTISLVNDGAADLMCTFGGRNAAGARTADVQCYNPLTNATSVKTSLPALYYDYSVGLGQVTFNNKVYLFGGFNTISTTAQTYRFDPVTDGFTQLSDLGLARGYINAAVVDGKIYALGGETWDAGLGILVTSDRTEVMASPEGAGTWNDGAVADLPTPLGEGRAFGFDSSSAFSFAGKIVLAGGAEAWPGESQIVFALDTRTDTYDADVPDLNIARRDHAAAVVSLPAHPAMWVFGGRSGSDSPPYAQPEYLVLQPKTLSPAIPQLLLLD